MKDVAAYCKTLIQQSWENTLEIEYRNDGEVAIVLESGDYLVLHKEVQPHTDVAISVVSTGSSAVVSYFTTTNYASRHLGDIGKLASTLLRASVPRGNINSPVTIEGISIVHIDPETPDGNLPYSVVGDPHHIMLDVALAYPVRITRTSSTSLEGTKAMLEKVVYDKAIVIDANGDVLTLPGNASNGEVMVVVISSLHGLYDADIPRELPAIDVVPETITKDHSDT